MPLYEYRCTACGAQFERIRKFSDPPLEVCPECGKGPVEKLVSSPAFQFKGSGWYITDYARKSESAAESTPAGKSSSEKSAKTETKDSSAGAGSDTTPAAKSDPSASTTSSTPSGKEKT